MSDKLTGREPILDTDALSDEEREFRDWKKALEGVNVDIVCLAKMLHAYLVDGDMVDEYLEFATQADEGYYLHFKVVRRRTWTYTLNAWRAAGYDDSDNVNALKAQD